MLKVVVDRSLCAGHALCHLVGPNLFPLGEDGAVAIEEVVVDVRDEADARAGMTACPEQAISVFRFE